MAHHVYDRSKDGWFLLHAGYAVETRKRYLSAVKMFLQWCVFTNVIFSAVRSFWDLDDLLTEYIHYRFEMLNGGGRQGAVNTIYGLRMLLPRLKGQLLTAERCVAHWKRL